MRIKRAVREGETVLAPEQEPVPMTVPDDIETKTVEPDAEPVEVERETVPA